VKLGNWNILTVRVFPSIGLAPHFIRAYTEIKLTYRISSQNI